MEPKQRALSTYELRLRSATNATTYEEEWIAFQRDAIHLVNPELRERLVEKYRQVSPMSQLHYLKTIDTFDERDRIAELKLKLLLLRGLR